MSTKAYLDLTGGLQVRIYMVLCKLFHPVYHRLSFNILREAVSYLDLYAVLPYVKDATLHLYSLDTGTETTIQLTLPYSQFTQCCLLTISEILIFPNLVTNVWEYSLHSHSLTSLPPLQKPRDWPAIIAYNGHLYVFCGFRVTTNERFSETWNSISESRFAHFQTNPCPISDKIYLCDTRATSGNIEVYDITMDCFVVVNKAIGYELTGSVTLAEGKDLVWLTCQGEWIVGKEDMTCFTPGNRPYAVTAMCPVLYQGWFYWRQVNGEVRCWKPI